MINVLIRGPILTQSGYGVHCRQVFKWLKEKENVVIWVQPTAWGMTPWYVDSTELGGLIGEIMKCTKELNVKPDVSFQVQLPDEWDPNVANKNVGVTAFVEGDKGNPKWVEACNKMDRVVVPSEFIKNTIQSTAPLTTPISVIPESFPESFENHSESLDLKLSTKFNFLVFGQLTATDPALDRKNTFTTVKWLYEAFRKDPDVGIILKVNHGTNSKMDKKIVKKLLKSFLDGINYNGVPKIYLLHGMMKETEIAGLYKNPDIKCLVSTTRGEGWGLPLLEAAACGMPVMATNWSAHTEFLNHGKWLPIDYTLTQIPPARADGRIFVNDMKWAEPDKRSFIKKVSKFRKGSTIPKQWAEDLSKKILKNYSVEAVNKIWNEEMRGIL